MNNRHLAAVALAIVAAGGVFWKYRAVEQIHQDTAGSQSIVPEQVASAGTALESGNGSPAPASNLEAASTGYVKNSNSPIGWAKLTTFTSLSAVYEAALRSADPDEAAKARFIAVSCVGLGDKPPGEDLASIRNDQRANKQLIIAEMKRSYERAKVYCSGANSSAFLDSYNQNGDKRSRLYLETLTPNPKEQSRPEYKQAVIQVLSNPEKFPAQFAAWLENGFERVLKNEHQLTTGQVLLVREELYAKLAGVDKYEEADVRNMFLCAERGICPSSLAVGGQEREDALRIAAEMEMRIRQQRWSLLGLI